MDAELILEAARATLAGAAPFPDIVAKLVTAGVEYYHVDYALMRKTFYSGDGDAVVTTIIYEDMPPVAAEFDAAALKAAILDSQQRGQKYRDFSHRAPGNQNTVFHWTFSFRRKTIDSQQNLLIPRMGRFTLLVGLSKLAALSSN